MRRYLDTIANQIFTARSRRNTSECLKSTFDSRLGCGFIFSAQSFSDIRGSSEALDMSLREKSASSSSRRNSPSPSRSPGTLNFAQYDFIGFDLDHTLATYNLKNLFTNQFNYLVNILNSQNGYQIETELTPTIVDFISRGLVVDIDRGNLLKVAFDGEIVRASHGTRALDPQEIAKIYGSKRQWKPLKEVIAKKFTTWKSRSDEMYSFMDFTDAAVTGVYALAINSGKNEKSVWADVIQAVITMYSDANWSSDIFNHASLYFNKTPETVLNWLSQLRTNAKTALITSNGYEFVPKIAQNTIGPNWESIFDFCVFNSKKPHFFSERSNFLDVEGRETEFRMTGNYTRGSIHAVIDALANELNREPKCVYIGDSPLHDFMFTSIDYIAIVEELSAECMLGCNHASADFISSRFWGSYLYENNKPTVFGKLALDGKFCAPDLNYFAEKPISYVFEKTLPRHHHQSLASVVDS